MKLEVFKSSYGYYNIRTIEGKPTEEMAEYLKTNGYRWSRNNNCWYPASASAKEANLHDDFVLKFQEKFFPADIDHVKTEKLDSQSLDERITYLENLITELQEAHKQDLEKIRILENQLTNHEETIVDYYTQQEQSQLDEEAEWEKENSLTTEEEKEIIENQKSNVNVTPEPTESLDSFFYDEMADDEDIYDERAQEDVHAGMVIEPKGLFEAAERIAREEEPEAERVFSENISENREVEVTPDELSIAKAVLPTTQYVSTLRYSQGEEGNFFKQKIKDVAAAVSKAPKIGGTDDMEQHQIVLRYFHPTGTETLVTEIGKDGEAYGYQCLNGDYEMAEWGYIDLNEVKNIRGMEADYHVEEGMTVERWLYKEQPDMFPQYARFAGVEEKAQEPLATEKTPFDVAQESGNDIEAIVKAQREEKYLDEIAPNRDVKRYYYNSYADVFLAVKFENGEGEYTFYDKDLNVIDGGGGYSGTDKPKNIVEYCEFAIRMRYSPDDIDPDGMTHSEYQERVERYNNYRLENWTFERESIFEEVLTEKGKKSENIRKKIEIKPVSLEEILAVMDMRPEMTADGKILVFDEQRKEYIDNGEDFEGNGQEAWEFSDAAEIFERLDIFIKEAFIDDMEDQLNAVGIKYTEDGHARSLEECCGLYKKEIENGNTQLSEGDLNLAFGIVNPETVILPEQNRQMSVEKDNDYAVELADWIIQQGLNNSTEMENYGVSYEDILENTNTPADWLYAHVDLINEALAAHNDNELLDYNPDENGENEFNLYFCSNSDERGENTLFKQNESGRWVRKTDKELLEENLNAIAPAREQAEQTPARDELLSHVKYFVTEFAEFPSYDDTENMSLEDAVKLVRERNQQEQNYTNFGTNARFTVGIEIDGEKFGNDGASYNPETGNFETLMFEANSLFRKYGAVALEELADEIKRQNNGLPSAMQLPCNFNPADFGLEENEGILIEAENGQMMTPDELRRWNEEQKMQHGQDSEFDELKEGKSFALEAAKELPAEDEHSELVNNQLETSWHLSQNKQNAESPTVYRICIQNRYDNHSEIERKVLNTVNSHDFPENFKKLFKSLPDEVNGEPAYFGNFFSAKPDFSSGYARYSNGRGWYYLLPFEVKDNKVEFAKSEESPTDFSWDEKIANKLVGEKFEIEDCYIEYDFSNKNIYGQKGFHTTNVEEFILKIKNAQKTQADIAESNSIRPQQPTSKKDIKAIREQCRQILKKPDSEITESDKAILAQYEGAGGLNEENRTNAGILNEFYTPNNLVEKVWQIVDAYAPEAKTVLEPSAGVGKFANNRPNNEFTMHELDETSARINKILHPEANIIQGAYQKQFFDDGERFKRVDFIQPKYDVVIGNPPYGAYNDKYKGLGEGKEFDRYEEYFISKGLDALKDENSVMAFVVPSGFLNTASDKQKELINSKGKLIDAYRLPVGTFPTTEVGTDIIVFQSWEKDRKEIDLNNHLVGVKSHAQFTNKRLGETQKNYLKILSENEWFKQHPEKILGEVKTRTNRFGKEEEYVTVHEGLTVQDELNKISSMLPKVAVGVEPTIWHEHNAQAPATMLRPSTTSLDNNSIAQAEEIASSTDIEVPKIFLKTTDEIEAAIPDDYAIPFKLHGEQMSKRQLATAMWYIKDATDENKSIRFYGEIWQESIQEIASQSGMNTQQVVDMFYGAYQEINKAAYLKSIGQEQETTEPTSDGQKTKTSRQKKEKWNIAKSKGEVMTAEEFSRLYGRDFDEREFPIWRATDWQGNINLENLSAEDLEYMHESGRYVQKDAGEWTHKVLFTSGNIYEKIEIQKMLKISEISRNGENSEMAKVFEKNIELLELSKKTPLDIEHIHFGLKTTLAEDFTITHFDEEGNPVELNLQESFILWAQNATLATQRWRKDIDYATSNISREELGEELTFYDIVDYIDGKSVKAEAVRGWRTWDMSDEEKAAEKAERKKEADLKRQTRADTANRLFDRYLHEGLDENTKKRLEAEYNRRFNSYISPDYSKLPLFVDGMSAYKGNSKFKLYDQQIKGISFLCNKGNGLLAYDVGVGKTAAGIVATVNQIQTERSKRPLIIVPNQVYAKWYTDIKQLFPNVQVNDLYNFNKKSVEGYVDKKNPHKLNIPENSISLCTYEALKNITFTDESCENALYQDFANLLSADFDGSDKENAASSDKIKGIIGSASHVKDSSYYFFEECGFDNLTVDEAHHFKNLWVVPKPKNKGESNEYSGIPNGKPSARALKMYGMTQLVQRNNDNRNVFMLTATPFTNSPTEVYSMLSYIGRERLHEAGISSLRSFFDEFAQTRQELGVNAKGEIDTKQVMKSWKELPALQSILTEFIDKVDGEEAGIIRPNKFTHVKQLDMSELQKQMREIDEERMAEVKEGNSAAVIVAMNNMRLSCVAPALANPAMYPGVDLPPLSQLVETSPKLKFVCDAIIDMYKDNPEKGQFMYVPLGKESHGIIKDYLVAHGIPKEAVEIINGEINSTTEKKEKISSRFNDEKDKVKILIGGQNTTEGIDLNGNSFVMYNCSLGWNPSETIQAEGRIWRQGNLQGNVHVVYPVMNDSIDSVLYQKHDEKRSRINELWNYKGDSLNIEDINPEDLKLDLIKDPVKKSKLILQEETKEARLELSKINLKIKSFDEIIEKRNQLSLDFDDSGKNIQKYERQINEYKETGLEVPEWIKSTLKGYKKDFEKASNQKQSVEKKLASWNCNTPEEEDAYIRNLNKEKHFYEEKIQHIEEGLPEILKRLEVERLEQKIMEYPVDKQREILESDILNNLRPMSEVRYEIKTMRHEKMLEEKLRAGEITQEEHDIYKRTGFEKYEKWLSGEIESLEADNEPHTENQEVAEEKSDRQMSVENKKPEFDVKQAVEAIPDETDSLKSEYQDITSIVVNYDGHWGEERNEKQGWRYEQKEFKNPKEALEFLKSAKIPRCLTIVTEKGFKFAPSDDEKYLNEMIDSGFEIKLKTSKAVENDLYGGLDLFTSMGISDEDMFVHSPEDSYFNARNDDNYPSEQLTRPEIKRDEIVLSNTTGVENNMLEPGIIKPEGKTTWNRQILHPTLLEQMQMGTMKIEQVEKEPVRKQEKRRFKKSVGMGY